MDRDETKEEKEEHSAFTGTAVCCGGVAYGRMSFLLQKCGQIHFFFLFSSLSSLIRFGFPSVFISGLGVSQKPPIFLSFFSHILE